MRASFKIASLLLAIAASPAFADGPKVSRLPGVPGQTPEAARAGRPAGEDTINLTISRGHAPPVSAATGVLARALRNDATTPRILRELTIMRTALFVKSDYEINQHIPMIKACGYTDAKIEAVKNWRASSLFDERERAARLRRPDARRRRRGRPDVRYLLETLHAEGNHRDRRHRVELRGDGSLHKRHQAGDREGRTPGLHRQVLTARAHSGSP